MNNFGPLPPPDNPIIWKGSVDEFFLQGFPAQLEYLPTEKSRKWRKSFSVKNFSPVARENGQLLKEQERWFAVRWVRREE